MSEEREKRCCAGGASRGLMVSIALNLFLVGLVLGPLLMRPPVFPDEGGMPGRFRPGPGFIFDQMGRDLPQDDAQKLRAIFDEERQNLHARHKDMHDAIVKIAAIMKEEKPDAVALRRALDEVRGLGEGFHENMARAFERIVTDLSPAARRKIAQRLAALPPDPAGAGPHPQDDARPMTGPEDAPPPGFPLPQ